MWILTEGIFNNTENDLQEITKIASVKIFLRQFLQKGFHVNSKWANDEENLMTGFSLNEQKPFF